MSGEGEMVEGFNKTAGGALLNDPPPTELPSGNQIALLVWWGRLVFGGFARIGRAVLFREGVMVARFSWLCLLV